MSEHTKEPWHQGTDERQIEGINGNIVCIVSGALLNESTIEDARRIVACVNACAGMDDPADAISMLQAQRDELLAAAKCVLEDIQNIIDYGYICNVMDDIIYVNFRNAIANAEKPPCA